MPERHDESGGSMPDTANNQASSGQAASAAAEALRRATRSTVARKKPRTRSITTTFSDDRDPTQLSQAVEHLVRDQGWEDRSAIAALTTSWAQTVGAEVAAHVVPVGYADGELHLEADSTAWATQVRLLMPQLSRAVAEQVGDGVVTGITVSGPQAPSWTKGKRTIKGRGPRDTYG